MPINPTELRALASNWVNGNADAVNSSGFLNFPTLEVQMEPET